MAFRHIYSCHRLLFRKLSLCGSPRIGLFPIPGEPTRLGHRFLAASTGRPDQKIARKSAHNTEWSRAISEAEAIVGYSTSFLNLRWILNDEIANVALHLRKIIGSNHPLLKTAK